MTTLTSNQIGGYKATVSNPNTSEQAKAHAQEVLEQVGGVKGGVEQTQDASNDGNSIDNRVLGGHKAALHNPNTSEAAKEHAREVLDSAGATHDESSSGTSNEATKHDEHTTRVLAGYKATLSNPNAGEEAKAHAQEVLRKEGEI